MKPQFKWTCGYRGETWFQVQDATGRYEVRLRNRPPDEYDLRIANGNDVRQEMITGVGILRCEHTGSIKARTLQEAIDTLTVSPELVAAFNEWRLAEHRAHIAYMESLPERYGTIGPDDKIRDAPLVARRGRLDIATHMWEVIP